MLKRSPTSKYLSIAATTGAIIVVIVIFSTITTWRQETIDHGQRNKYYLVNNSFLKGDEITIDDLSEHEMFSKDAPKNSIETKTLSKDKTMFANIDISKNSILQKNMLVESLDATLDDDYRIIFIPSTDKITSDIAQYSDIIATLPDGFGSEVIAYDAQILFDASPQIKSDSENNTESQDAGYFVKVTVDEASAISTALSTGDLHFALKKSVTP